MRDEPTQVMCALWLRCTNLVLQSRALDAGLRERVYPHKDGYPTPCAKCPRLNPKENMDD